MTPKRCAEIHAACFTTPRPWRTDEFAELLANSTIFLCENGHGFALGRLAGPEAELLTIAIAPNHQRQGRGRTLLQDFEARARDKQAEELFLEVAAQNAGAIALYQSAGYVQCGMRKDYYQSPKGPRVSALVFRKTISPTQLVI